MRSLLVRTCGNHRNADLSGADMTESVLISADFTNARLSGAKLECQLNGTNMRC